MKNSAYFSVGIAVLLVFVSGALYGAVYYLLSEEKAKGADLQAQIQTKHLEIARAAKAQSALASLNDDESVIGGYSLSKEDIVPFLENLQSTGKPLGAGVQVLSVSDDRSYAHPRIIISLLITGSFDAVMRTIGTLENAPYDSTLNSLTLDSGGDTKGPKQWSAATVLSVGVHRQATTTPSKP